MLKLCNLWHKLYLSKLAAYTAKALFKVCRRVDKLPASSFVEAMFYLTVCRTDISMPDVEKRFIAVFPELNINEIGIVCLSFFKTEQKILTGQMFDLLYDRTIEEINGMRDISLANILKTLRYSTGPSHANKLIKLCEALVPKVETCGIICCLHISLLGTNLQCFHQDLIEAVTRRFNKDIKEMRLKDIERFTFVLGLYDFKSKSGIEREFLLKVIDELKLRVDEILDHPRCFPSAVHFLSMCGVYDADIISSVINEDFIKLAYGK